MNSFDQAGSLALLSDIVKEWLKDHNDHFIVGPSHRILGYCTEIGSKTSFAYWGTILVNDKDGLVTCTRPKAKLSPADPEFFPKLEQLLRLWHRKYAYICPQKRKWHS